MVRGTHKHGYNIIIEAISIFSTLGDGEVDLINLAKFVMCILCFGNGFRLLFYHKNKNVLWCGEDNLS